ncbi:hypothetical protein SCHPADRAFT_989431 [Schizopora paradoxa]|uniref:Uncharacterized protein n=1 Tax=Schizopora paradoxa TaxID=27342 RepID=A0A0H2RIK4_9AGAM|nr:hypothetical protein SCHPADRAFT_989431 [Schizopora paradoxa]
MSGLCLPRKSPPQYLRATRRVVSKSTHARPSITKEREAPLWSQSVDRVGRRVKALNAKFGRERWRGWREMREIVLRRLGDLDHDARRSRRVEIEASTPPGIAGTDKTEQEDIWKVVQHAGDRSVDPPKLSDAVHTIQGLSLNISLALRARDDASTSNHRNAYLVSEDRRESSRNIVQARHSPGIAILRDVEVFDFPIYLQAKSAVTPLLRRRDKNDNAENSSMDSASARAAVCCQHQGSREGRDGNVSRRRRWGQVTQRAEDSARNLLPFYAKNLWSVHSPYGKSEPSNARKIALETTLGAEKKVRRLRKVSEMFKLNEWTHKPLAEPQPRDLRERSKTFACCKRSSVVPLDPASGHLQERQKIKENWDASE